MTLGEVQKQAGALTAEERRSLAAFLIALRMKETGEWEGANQLEPPAKDGWIRLEEAKQHLLDGRT